MAKIKDLELIKNIDILLTRNIVIYGAGNYGKQALKLLEMAKLSAFSVCDSSPERWGELVYNKYKVISPRELVKLEQEKELIIIIAIMDLQSVNVVIKMLDDYGLGNRNCYTYFGLENSLRFHMKQTQISQFDQMKMNYISTMALEFRAIKTYKLYRFWAVEGIMSRNAILVYQPGKVGSTTVCDSLVDSGVSAVHIHYLNGDWRDTATNLRLIETDEKKAAIEILRNTAKVKIITLIREPIGRAISVFFENLGNHTITEFHSADLLKGAEAMLWETYERFIPLGFQFEWFNREIKEIFGVDIYEHEFDKTRGFQVICEKNVEILVIKVEKLNQCQEIIGKFAGITGFQLENRNTGSNKLYHFSYEEVKEQIRLPRQLVDGYYKGNVAMDHFYTQEEKASFLKKWAKNIVD